MVLAIQDPNCHDSCSMGQMLSEKDLPLLVEVPSHQPFPYSDELVSCPHPPVPVQGPLGGLCWLISELLTFLRLLFIWHHLGRRNSNHKEMSSFSIPTVCKSGHSYGFCLSFNPSTWHIVGAQKFSVDILHAPVLGCWELQVLNSGT